MLPDVYYRVLYACSYKSWIKNMIIILKLNNNNNKNGLMVKLIVNII